VGLYEWLSAGKDPEKFVQMDLNGDGFLTAEEYLRYTKMPTEIRSGFSSASSGSSSSSNSFSGWGRDRGSPSSSDRGSDKGEKGKKGKGRD
jgi:hypothetical protein